MADTIGPGWWLASDGQWYPPHLHPQAVNPSPGAALPSMATASAFSAAPGTSMGAYTGTGLPTFASFDPAGPPPTGMPPAGFGPPPVASFGSPMAAGPRWDYQPPSTNGLAVASLVLAIVSLIGLGSILGIIFGFVARGQIGRSNGTQKGGGLALAGIIVGFVTLALVLAAIAIPTFLGVEASNASVVRLSPSPIALGTPVEGGRAQPVPWVSGTEPVNTTLAVVPGGMEMTIASAEQAEFAGLPLTAPLSQDMQLSATVGIATGSQANGIGLGCVTPTRTDQFAFFIHQSGLWQVVHYASAGTRVVDAGESPAIRSTGSNVVTIACGADSGQPDRTVISFEVNGVPVATDLVNVASTQWAPTVQLCSCASPDTGAFLNTAYYTGTPVT